MKIWMRVGATLYLNDKEAETKECVVTKECIVICNTRLGYCTPPVKCKSISEAIRYAKDRGMGYRIFVDGRCIERGR